MTPNIALNSDLEHSNASWPEDYGEVKASAVSSVGSGPRSETMTADHHDTGCRPFVSHERLVRLPLLNLLITITNCIKQNLQKYVATDICQWFVVC